MSCRVLRKSENIIECEFDIAEKCCRGDEGCPVVIEVKNEYLKIQIRNQFKASKMRRAIKMKKLGGI